MRRYRGGCSGAVTLLVLSLGTGCGGPSAGEAGGDVSSDASSPDSSTADVTEVDSTVDASTDASTDASRDADIVLPVISDLAITPNPNSILSATLTFTTNVPTTASVLVTNTADGGAANTFTVGPTTGLATSFRIPILGMRAQSTFDIAVEVEDAASNVATGATTFATGALPPFIPPITVVTNDPTKTAPGFTLVTIWVWDGSPAATINSAESSIVALDAEGQVVWYDLPGSGHSTYPNAPKKLPNGDLVFLTGQTGWEEIDMMGNVVRSYSASGMGLDSMHHEITPEPASTDFLALSTELRDIPGYPTKDGGTTTYAVVGAIINELGEDGGVLHQWHEFDMLDPHREGDVPLFQTPYWNHLYTDAGATKDWTHSNGVIPDPSDGTLIASSRTQNLVYKFTRNDGGTPSVVWKLGEGGDFTLTNPGETFQYGQHGVNILPNGHLMVFDNGNGRPAPDGGLNQYSRALEYALDLTNMTATIVWQYEETPPFFAQFLGSSYLLANGDVLICAGGLTDDPTGSFSSPTNLKYARIMEVTHDPAPTKLLELDVRQELGAVPSDPSFSGYSVYRATRLPSLY